MAEISPSPLMMFQLYKLLNSSKKKCLTWQVTYMSKNTSGFLLDISLAQFFAVPVLALHFLTSERVLSLLVHLKIIPPY